MTLGLPLLVAFLRRDASVQVSYRADFVLQLSTIVFTLALFFYLGKIVDATTFAREAGFDRGYFAFVIIGLALLRIVQTSLTSFANRLRQDQMTGTLEALMATPTPPSVVILFSAAFDLFRATMLSAVLMATAIVAFGASFATDPVGLVGAAATLVACLVLFASLGVLLAAFTIVFKQTTAVLALALTGLALLGGVYFPLDLLPQPLQAVGEILPFTWGLDAMRSALLDGQVELGRLALLAGFSAVALPISQWVFGRALVRARRDGSLAQY
jgi:ABC-2 type transport system permease protein